jgi:two-component system sensor histidine kinase FlrB
LNPAAIAMLGESALGQHWGDVVAAALEPTMTVGEWQLGEGRVSMAESILPSGGGKILLLHDISSAHRMKDELERSQRLAAMGEMAASLAHQLRTPLAAALLYTASLGQPDMSATARAKFADKATGQLRRLERLIQDVLLFARGETIGRDVFPASELFQDCAQTVEPLMRERGVGFTVSDECSGGVLVGSRKALYGALVNLLENALQATPVGGLIRFSAQRRGDRVDFSVQDSGPGVPPDLQRRIFEPFYTTKGQGTGLGLAIALGVARAGGGTIDILSPRDGGAEFVMRLPLAADNNESGCDE